VSTRAGGQAATPSGSGRQFASALHDLLASFIRLTPRDMSLTSVSVLSTLDRLGPRRITELAVSEGVSQPAVTTLVASLTRAGYVERHSDPADKRVVMVAITEAGAGYLRTRRAASTAVFAEAVEQLTPDEAAALGAALPVVEHLRDLVDELRSLRQGRK
jgi:DNA-binding MarR family transcriptional regulator